MLTQKPFTPSLFLPTALFIFMGCNGFQKKDNQLRYTIKAGETFQVMLDNNPSTGSYTCFLNEKSIKVASLIKSEWIKDGPADCDGCGGTDVYTFKGMATGTDSIKMKTMYAGDQQADCSGMSDASADPDKLFIVTVE